MEDRRILIGSIVAMVFAAFVATYLGHSVIGFILFVFALTPLPANTALWLRDWRASRQQVVTSARFTPRGTAPESARRQSDRERE